jgi:hypothetical protein
MLHQEADVKTRASQKWQKTATGFLFQRLHGKYQRAPACDKPDGSRNKNGRNLNFFTGVSEFKKLGPRATSLGCRRCPASGTGNFFGSFREFLRSFEELWIRQLRTGRRAPSSGTYPQDIHNLVYIREFGSLK